MPILSKAAGWIALVGLSSATMTLAAAPDAPAIDQHDATAATRAVLEQAARDLPAEDGRDFEFAQRGFIASWPDAVIRQDNGRPAFDLAGNDFIDGNAPDTVHPSLWRQNRVLRAEGLFRLAPGLYQVRNFDNSNVTFIETPNGWIVVDPLTFAEVSRAAFDLVRQNVADKPVLAVIYTHSHTDHFAGAPGVTTAQDVASGKVQVIAPKGFVDEVVSEWIIAGTAMGRRAFYQFGYFLPRGPKGHVGMGMGTAIAAGKQGLIVPTQEIEHTGESVTIDGVELVFQMAQDTEAPAEFNLWIPHAKAILNSETATGTLHNLQTLRGAKVRDGQKWSESLTELLRLWGGEAEVLLASHHWPRYGNDVIRQHLSHQRDAYKFIHDQSVRRMNLGQTPDEIAEDLRLPPLVVSDAIHAGLPLDEAADFLQSLVEAAHVEADLGNVACQFLRWMFEAAVSEFGATRVRSTANEAGHGFSHLAELPSATASQRQKTKIMAKQARRRGLFLPSPNEALVTEALGAAFDGGGAHAGFAVHWIAGLSARPVNQYRHFSRKLLTLVETA